MDSSDPTGLRVIEHIAPELSRIYIEKLRFTREVLIPVLSRLQSRGFDGVMRAAVTEMAVFEGWDGEYCDLEGWHTT